MPGQGRVLVNTCETVGLSFYGSSLARPALLHDKSSNVNLEIERENAVNGLLGGVPGAMLNFEDCTWASFAWRHPARICSALHALFRFRDAHA